MKAGWGWMTSDWTGWGEDQQMSELMAEETWLTSSVRELEHRRNNVSSKKPECTRMQNREKHLASELSILYWVTEQSGNEWEDDLILNTAELMSWWWVSWLRSRSSCGAPHPQIHTDPQTNPEPWLRQWQCVVMMHTTSLIIQIPNPSIHCLGLQPITDKLEPAGQVAGYTLYGSPIHHRTNRNQTNHSLTWAI